MERWQGAAASPLVIRAQGWHGVEDRVCSLVWGRGHDLPPCHASATLGMEVIKLLCPHQVEGCKAGGTGTYGELCRLRTLLSRCFIQQRGGSQPTD